MSTRSLIAIREKAKTARSTPVLKVIYCHWDGYPSHNGRILLEHYTDVKKVKALMALGDLSSLAPDLGEKHDFDVPYDKQPKNMCMAYGRDRGEKGTKMRTYKYTKADLQPHAPSALPKTFLKATKDSWCEYLYVFDENTGHWVFSKLHEDTIALKELTTADCKDK